MYSRLYTATYFFAFIFSIFSKKTSYELKRAGSNCLYTGADCNLATPTLAPATHVHSKIKQPRAQFD